MMLTGLQKAEFYRCFQIAGKPLKSCRTACAGRIEKAGSSVYNNDNHFRKNCLKESRACLKTPTTDILVLFAAICVVMPTYRSYKLCFTLGFRQKVLGNPGLAEFSETP